ncbi:MAG: hypothetical protein CMI54_07550 [Parcubacteria group bacterium]|nr:hypothetical protein [Parcubacteria group bacterium]|tara:strand:- start:10628 stop:11071 length:444 start_codon:yes stop_codon:yes gene_type:complete
MSLISDDEKDQIKSAYGSFFETFRQGITVHKVSEIVIADIDLDQIFGYNEDANPNNYSYQHESKNFYALVVYPSRGDQTLGVMTEMAAQIPEGEVRIKVQRDCKDYIQAGKTEKIEVKGKNYTLISTEAEVNNILTGYFIFKLKEIK